MAETVVSLSARFEALGMEPLENTDGASLTRQLREKAVQAAKCVAGYTVADSSPTVSRFTGKGRNSPKVRVGGNTPGIPALCSDLRLLSSGTVRPSLICAKKANGKCRLPCRCAVVWGDFMRPERTTPMAGTLLQSVSITVIRDARHVVHGTIGSKSTHRRATPSEA